MASVLSVAKVNQFNLRSSHVLISESGAPMRLLRLIFLLLGLAHVVWASERYDAWQSNRPFTQTAWQTHRYQGGEQVNLEYFHESGLNTFFDGVRSGSESSKHPYSRSLPTVLLAALGYEPKDLPRFQDDFKKARATHKNLIGVILGDEVQKGGPSTYMHAVRDWLAEHHDSTISSLITFSSIGSMSPEHWDYILETIGPDVMLFQHYPSFRSDQSRAGYYRRLEKFARWSRKRGVPWWVYPRAYSSDRDGIFSESELRLQRFTSLAYGVRGFADFMWASGPGTPAVLGSTYWDGSFQPTTTYQQLAPINREIAHVTKALIRLSPVGAFHLDRVPIAGDQQEVRYWMDRDDDLPNWLRRTGRLANLTAALNRNHLVVGFFRDDAGEEYFLVVNKDVAQDRTGDQLATEVILSFHPSVKAIQHLRRSDGVIERIDVDRHYGFLLPGGTGELFKFDTGGSFAGHQPAVKPKLTAWQPGDRGTAPRLSNNQFAFMFDSDAHAAVAEIRRTDENGQTMGPDQAEKFQRTVSQDGRTIWYREEGAVLSNKATYQIVLHWADHERPLEVRTLRGDVNGDGDLSDADLSAVKQNLDGDVKEAPRVDVDGNGRVDKHDVKLVDRLIHPIEKFQWVESFDDYPLGPLTGRGPWQDIESIPAPFVTKRVVTGPAEVSDAYDDLDGKQKLKANVYPLYKGNLAIFHRGGGVGEGGILRGGFLARLGKSGVERLSVFVANSTDIDGTQGVLGCHVSENGGASIYTDRGVALIGGTDATSDEFKQVGAKQGTSGKGMAYEFFIDFDDATITWKCQDLVSGTTRGPRTVAYSGKFQGLDTVSFWICGSHTQLDHIWLQNH